MGWIRVGSTYERYKSALEQIADGADNAQEIATKALTSLKGEPTYKWKREQEARKARTEAHRRERRKYCKAFYLEWLRAGKPTIAAFARAKGKSQSATERALTKYERTLPYKRQILRQASSERSIKRSQAWHRKREEALRQNQTEWIRVRYFDREESAEALAAELGWTAEQMQAFIEAARMDRWVTTTEYNAKRLELWKKTIGEPND